MAKRSGSTTSTPTKKSKVSHDQHRLDHFFASPSKRLAAKEPKGKEKATAASAREIINIDSSEDELETIAPGGLRATPQPAAPSGAVTESLSAAPEAASRSAAGSQPAKTPQQSFATKTLAPVTTEPPVYAPLAVDPPFFDIATCPWEDGKPAPYSFLAQTLTTLTTTRSRIAILQTLTNTLRVILQFHPNSLLATLYLLSNSLSPPYSPLELGLGPSVLSKAIQHVSGLTPAALKRLFNKSGDPGDVAFEAKSNVRTLVPHPPLTITGVYSSMLAIANAKGAGAARQKQSIVEKLLVAARGEEVRFLVRTLSMNLRVGAVRTSILTAVARAMVLTPPANLVVPVSTASEYIGVPEIIKAVKPIPSDSKKKVPDGSRERLIELYTLAESLVKRVYVQHPDYGHIAAALCEVGLDGLAERVPLTVGIPLHPTLGSPTRSLDEIYERLEQLPFAAEFKYDGQRAQIHASKHGGVSCVRVFSRHLEDMTGKYPDIVALVETMCEKTQTESFIMDAEIVAIDPEDGSLKTFQELSNRARKDVKAADVTVAVCVFAFDLMHLDGEKLLSEPFRRRRSLLRERFPPLTSSNAPAEKSVLAARFDHVRCVESEEGREAVETFWQESVESRCEGLMIKLLDNGEVVDLDAEPDVTVTPSKRGRSRRKPLPATYEPDKRTSAWLKLKKDYVAGLGDSLDLVPIGAWHGNGRKAQWWSPVLLAVWDPNMEKLVAVCKCMSGFSDAFYKAMRERYEENSETCSTQPLWDCEVGGLRPKVYFKPSEVWEIRGADITISPVSVAARGLVSSDRGLSLRFPRFIRVREDKAVEMASTPTFLAGMYRDQQGRGRDMAGADEGDLVDVDVQDSTVEDDDNDE